MCTNSDPTEKGREDHIGFIVYNLVLYLCKRLFLQLEPLTPHHAIITLVITPKLPFMLLNGQLTTTIIWEIIDLYICKIVCSTLVVSYMMVLKKLSGVSLCTKSFEVIL